MDYDDAPQEGHPVGVVRVVQCVYNTPLQPGIMWEVLGAADGGGGVLLRQPVNQEPNEQLALHYTVEVIPPRPAPPQLPDQTPVSLRFRCLEVPTPCVLLVSCIPNS